MQNNNNMMILPTLYGLSSKGKIKQWSISVQEHQYSSIIYTSHGYIDGKIVTTTKEILKGKNIGKSNETTHFQQACNEASSTYQKKLDEQYKLSVDQLGQTEEIELPMLAHEFSKRGHDISYPCYVQPKLNGVRCLIKRLEDHMRATSRGGKEYKAIKSILISLQHYMKVLDIYDGELYNHSLTFQEIVTAIKNEEDLDVNLPLIQFWIYDVAILDVTFEDRYQMILDLFGKECPPSIVVVPTYLVNDEAELAEKHAAFTEAGFEGTMIRNVSGLYTFKHRSADLQKYKDFIDEEFEIIGGQEGVGLSAGQCTFICQTKDGKPFGVRCIGQNSVREEQWQNLKHYIGKLLTVKFQNYSDDGIPIFPVGIGIRDYE